MADIVVAAAPVLGAEDDIMKYLLSADEDSSPGATPPLFDETTSSNASPSHWTHTQEDFSIAMDATPFVFSGADTLDPYNTYTFDNAESPFVQTSPSVQSPASAPTTPTSVPLSTPPLVNILPSPAKKMRTKKRPAAEIDVPSPEEETIVLPRDTLLQISSQKMEQYVETLQSKRNLSADEHNELKRQKRLIKNRESAQLSRERRRAYIDELEAKIAQMVTEANQLKEENSSLRKTLSQYQPGIEVKTEPGAVAQQSQINTKLGGLFTVGGGARPSTTAKAGVCLLIVLFSFGLFMNGANRESGLQLRPTMSSPINQPEMHVTGHSRGIVQLDEEPAMQHTNKKRRFEELQIEELPVVSQSSLSDSRAAPTVVPTSVPTSVPTLAPTTTPTFAPTTTPTFAPTTAPTVAPTTAPTTAPTRAPASAQPTTTVAPRTPAPATPAPATPAPLTISTISPTSVSPVSESRQVISVVSSSNRVVVTDEPEVSSTAGRFIHPTEVQTAGIFKVSYSVDPAKFIADNEHSRENNTYMLFLDPRPDLNAAEMKEQESERTTHSHALVAKSGRSGLPPMIISLELPDHIANGSNPLLLPDDISSSDSIIEITCQVVDVSITTNQRN